MSYDNHFQPTLVVMAAGMGSRYGGLKQLEGVGPSGETILEYSIYDALRAGFGKVVFIIRKDIEAAFNEVVLSRFDGKIPYACVYQEMDALPEGFVAPKDRKKPWGTGHAVLMAREEVPGPFAVINADDFYGSGAYLGLIEFFEDNDDARAYALAGYRLQNTLSANGVVSRGVCHADGDVLIGVEEVGGIGFEENQIRAGARVFDGRELVSMNLWGFMPSLFDLLERDFQLFLKEAMAVPNSEFYLPACVSAAIATREAHVQILPVEDKWYGVTYREDRPEIMGAIAAAIESGLYPSSLWG